MSQANAIGPAPTSVDARVAIARAAAATGTDFAFLLAQARIESGLDPSARAASSSAAGLYQFTRRTWLETLDRHGAEHGLDWAGAAISEGRVSDPSLRARLLALRFDPELSARMAAELAGDNRAALAASLGREPDHAELYLAHFLGTEGAVRFLSALDSDPAQSAAALLPAAAGANRTIFYDRGAPRSLGEVIDLMRGKLENALYGESPINLLPSPSGRDEGYNAGREPLPQPLSNREGLASRSRSSMADTLASAFGPSTEAPAAVRAAYGRLRAFGL